MKIRTKKTEVVFPSWKKRKCMLQVSGIALQQVHVSWGGIDDTFLGWYSRISSILWWCSRMTESRIWRLIDRLVNQTQFCVCYCSVFTERKPSNMLKLSVFLSVFVPILTNMVMILVDDWKNIIPSARASMGFVQSVHGVTLCDKLCSCEFCKYRMWNYFSIESRDPRYVGSAMCLEWPTKDWRDKSRCIKGKAVQRSTKDQLEHSFSLKHVGNFPK